MDSARCVGVRIAAIRRRRGLTQQDLADRIGRSVNSLSSMERGLHNPTFETLRRLAGALEAPMADFLAPPGGEADSPEQAARFAEMLEAARRLAPGDLNFAARVMGLIAGRYGR